MVRPQVSFCHPSSYTFCYGYQNWIDPQTNKGAVPDSLIIKNCKIVGVVFLFNLQTFFNFQKLILHCKECSYSICSSFLFVENEDENSEENDSDENEDEYGAPTSMNSKMKRNPLLRDLLILCGDFLLRQIFSSFNSSTSNISQL